MNTVHYNIWFDLIVDMYGYRDNRLVSTALVDSLNFCKTRQSRNIWRSRLYAPISDYSSLKVNNYHGSTYRRECFSVKRGGKEKEKHIALK